MSADRRWLPGFEPQLHMYPAAADFKDENVAKMFGTLLHTVTLLEARVELLERAAERAAGGREVPDFSGPDFGRFDDVRCTDWANTLDKGSVISKPKKKKKARK